MDLKEIIKKLESENRLTRVKSEVEPAARAGRYLQKAGRR